MSKAIAVYHSKKDDKLEYMFALRHDGKCFEREFKRHTRFGKKWSEWRLTSLEEVIKLGHDSYKRVDKEVKVVLP